MSNEKNKKMMEYYERTSSHIQPGKKYMLYYLFCKDCKKYKRIISSPPIGPGGIISCPYCKEARKNGPGIEQSYGNIQIKQFLIELPKTIDE